MIPLVIGSFVIMYIGILILARYEDNKELKASIFLTSLGMFGLILSAVLSVFF